MLGSIRDGLKGFEYLLCSALNLNLAKRIPIILFAKLKHGNGNYHSGSLTSRTDLGSRNKGRRPTHYAWNASNDDCLKNVCMEGKDTLPNERFKVHLGHV